MTSLETQLTEDGLRLTRNMRVVSVHGRRKIDVSAMTNSVQELDFFVPTDPVDNVSGWRQVSDEPQLLFGISTPQTNAYGILGHRFRWNSSEVFGAAPTQVNSIQGVLSRADARIILGSVPIVGPHTFDDFIGGERSSRVSAATTAGELLGGTEGETEWLPEGQVVYVPPQSTLNPKVRFDGTQFASRVPAVTADFVLYWDILLVAANVTK